MKRPACLSQFPQEIISFSSKGRKRKRGRRYALVLPKRDELHMGIRRSEFRPVDFKVYRGRDIGH
jgi:hypothetical protein